ncbi:MAG: putative metal-dependent hydrolase [Acidobacteria bacterium]|nr:putative metal-dependent hydrolase [Acidobacteriota bacterium]
MSTRGDFISKIESLPARLEAAVTGATEAQLARPYKPGGWNARQVIHHLADSHMNAFIRCRLITTEENPGLKPYDQDAWARLPDSATGPLEPSLAILRGLHARWAAFFRALPEEAWSRQGMHPDDGPRTIAALLESYCAHGERHLGHIQAGIAG